MASFFCSKKFFFLLFLLSAVPIAILVSLETAQPTTHVYQYHSNGWFRECTKWDHPNSRFIVSSFEGGLGEIPVPDDHASPAVLREIPILKDADYAGNATLGFTIDRPRNRVVVAIADLFGNRYSALAAYDLTTWKRLFLTQLSGSGDEKTMADDVTVDAEGNAYVTDLKTSKIWKVGVDGEFLLTIKSPLFIAKEWYKNFFTLNGIAYHPNGYLLVIHTSTGQLFKIEIEKDNEVKLVNVVDGPLSSGDGIELISPTKLVVAGNPATRLVESTDDWETATTVGKFPALKHRLATASTVKDGKVYINHLFGMGYPKKKHVLVEAVFSS
ncbi:hypothetical protein RJ640_021736 [Escallonia rubra]|uniref:Uncharacterized protein n=1 Tax=Escallonia rubra TaxID=112253 RepID=A0AA88QFN0_9ASTE|nr:hypothetical protein RJ640_021736 [Escallonia rubra]